MKKRVLFIIAAIVPALLLAGFINSTFATLKHHNIEMGLANDEAQIQKIEANIIERFSNFERDLAFLMIYVNPFEDNESNLDLLESIQPRLEEVLPSFYLANPMYQKISILDQNGQEISFKNGEKGFTREFKDKVDSDYFKGATAHKSGNAHVSFEGDSLNISCPIFDTLGNLEGVLVLNLRKEDLVNELFSSVVNEEKVMLIEDTGEYLLTLNPGAKNFSSDYSSEMFSEIMSLQSGYLELGENTVLTFNPVQLDDHKWFLLIENNKEILNQEITTLEWQLKILIALVFASIAALIALRFASYRKEFQAEQLRQNNDELENLNAQLIEKQTALEEQTAVVEELNALLEEDLVRIEEQKDLLKAITDSIKWGIALTNSSNETVFVNKLWGKYFPHYDPSDTNPCGFGHFTDAETLIETMMVGTENSGEAHHKLKESLGNFQESYRIELVQFKPVKRHLRVKSLPCIAKDGHVIGRLIVCSDISRYKEIDRLKSELISTVSHELRTPMSSIMGFSELLLTRDLSQERARKYIEIIYNQADRLTHLISDFLDIQRMQSGKLMFNKERISIDEVIPQAFDLFKASQTHQILYTKEANGLVVEADVSKILQVMSNLLSNAIKYSPQGGEVIVRVTVQEGKLKVGVTDKGLGIPSEALPKLFAKFFRVDNDDRREIGGTGLGLAICQEIIQAHGGEIWAESTFGQGSSFYFTLPLIEDTSSIKDNTLIKNSLTKPVPTSSIDDAILLVEDDQNFVQLMQEILHEAGFKTLSVDNGKDALELIKKTKCKILILDIVLQGDLTGWDVLKALKGDPETANIPVIISSIDEHKESYSEGIREYLTKPFKPKDLLKVVQKVSKEELDAKMMMHNDKGLQDYVVTVLNNKGIKVKDCQLSDEILMITLDGEN